MADTEESLLSRYVRTRDAEAFGELVARHKDMVYAVCRRILRNRTDAEDAAQECFLALMRQPERAQGSPAGWLHRVAVRCAIDLARQETARKAREAKAMKEEAVSADAPPWEEVSGQVDEAIDALPDDLRVPMIRYYLEGRRQEDIATELGVTQATVSKRVDRGTEELRLRMTKAGVTVSGAALVTLLSANAVEAAPATLSSALGHMAATGPGAAGAVAGTGIGFAKIAAIVLVTAGAVGVTIALYPVQRDAPRPPVVTMTVPQPPDRTLSVQPATPPPPAAPEPPAPALPAPEEAVVLDPKLTWNRTGWWHSYRTPFVWEQTTPVSRVFVVGEPDKGYIWTYPLAAPIAQPKFGKVVMTYRARNTSTSGQYTLWLDDTRGPDSGGVSPFRSRDLIADGEVHEATCDLATLKPAGPIISMALGVTCGPKGPATFEMLGLRFERTGPADGETVGQDAPVTVTVRDTAGDPLIDALVTMDAERLNYARSARTNAGGIAEITPLKTQGEHMIRVSKAGCATVEGAWTRGSVTMAVTLQPAALYGGKVVDEAGAPVAGAVVAMTEEEYPSPRRALRAQRALNVTTNAQGVWLSGPVAPAPAGLRLQFSHLDFHNGQETTVNDAELRTGAAVTVLRHGIAVNGIVRNAEGRAVNKAAVVIVQPGVRPRMRPAALTGADGRFAVRQVPPGEFSMVVNAEGNCPECAKGLAAPDMEPVEIAMGVPNTVRFRVVDPQGGPILNAKVWVESWRGNNALDLYRPTNKEGRAVWTSAPADEVVYTVTAKAHESVRGLPMTARTEEYVITLKPVSAR